MTSGIILDAAEGRAQLEGLTVEIYDHLIENHLLPENTGTELIDGFIVHKDRAAAGERPMTIGDRHTLVIQRLVRYANKFFDLGAHLRFQQPVVIQPDNEPGPDIAVTIGSEEDYDGRKPGPKDVSSVIEVADSSLNRDLVVKLRVYAAASIAQYVVVDLVNDVVLVHSNPTGTVYGSVTPLKIGEVLRVLAPKGATVDVPVKVLLP
jgi:hypothetical protein